MAFQPVPGTGQISAIGRMPGGGPWVNTFFFGLGTTLDQALTDDIADDWAEAYMNLVGAMHTEWHLDSVVVTDLRTEGAPQFQSSSSMPVDGTSSANPLPYQAALVVSWLTALRGRSFRGRTYLGGFTEAASDGAGPGSATLALVEAFRDDIISNGTVSVKVVSRFHDRAKRLEGVATAITTGRVGTVWDTQRRRKPAEA